jgi:DNA-binding response OmpR family regulator
METSVLVVEDDVEINELLGEYLSLEGMKYLQALSGKAGAEQAAAAHPDAIILDLMLPDIDGFQVARQVASHRQTYDIPIIMLTCMNQDRDREHGIASGAHRYMNKPFLPDDLLANVRSALEWKRTLATRAPAGEIEISMGDPCGYHRATNEMIRDLFTRTKLSDRAVGQIRAGFTQLADWATDWGKKYQRDPHLLIEYRITDSAGNLNSNGQAATIHWQISEKQPGLLDEMLFKHVTHFVSSATSGKEAAEPSPLARWYRFLAKCGVSKFNKDSTKARVYLERPLADATSSVPVVVIDGARTPTRLRQEATKRL